MLQSDLYRHCCYTCVSPDDSRYTGCLSEGKTPGIPLYCALLSESSKSCSFTIREEQLCKNACNISMLRNSIIYRNRVSRWRLPVMKFILFRDLIKFSKFPHLNKILQVSTFK